MGCSSETDFDQHWAWDVIMILMLVGFVVVAALA